MLWNISASVKGKHFETHRAHLTQTGLVLLHGLNVSVSTMIYWDNSDSAAAALPGSFSRATKRGFKAKRFHWQPLNWGSSLLSAVAYCFSVWTPRHSSLVNSPGLKCKRYSFMPLGEKMWLCHSCISITRVLEKTSLGLKQGMTLSKVNTDNVKSKTVSQSN